MKAPMGLLWGAMGGPWGSLGCTSGPMGVPIPANGASMETQWEQTVHCVRGRISSIPFSPFTTSLNLIIHRCKLCHLSPSDLKRAENGMGIPDPFQRCIRSWDAHSQCNIQTEWEFPFRLEVPFGVGIPTPNATLERNGNWHSVLKSFEVAW